MWKRYLNLCWPSRGAVVAVLIIVNITLGIYTLPLLLQNDQKHDNRNNHGDYFKLPKRNAQEIGRLAHVQEANASLLGLSNDFEYNPHEYFYIHQPTAGCEEDSPFLLIAVCSAAHHFDLRQAIRQTWASVIHKHRLSTKLVFMLGAPSGEYEHLQQHVTKESQMYGDVIQEDFVDTYVNLTVKSIGVLKWAIQFCPGVKFLMKTDDDVFVNIANIISLLMDLATKRTSQSARFMLGHVIKNAKPLSNRSSKWYAPTALFKGKTYPTYMSGSAYVITGNIIEDLYSAATTRRSFWLEDIYITGMLSSQLDIPLVHNDKFTYNKPRILHPCFFRAVMSAHELSTAELHQIWSKLHTLDLDCTGYLHSFLNKLAT